MNMVMLIKLLIIYNGNNSNEIDTPILVATQMKDRVGRKNGLR